MFHYDLAVLFIHFRTILVRRINLLFLFLNRHLMRVSFRSIRPARICWPLHSTQPNRLHHYSCHVTVFKWPALQQVPLCVSKSHISSTGDDWPTMTLCAPNRFLDLVCSHLLYVWDPGDQACVAEYPWGSGLFIYGEGLSLVWSLTPYINYLSVWQVSQQSMMSETNTRLQIWTESQAPQTVSVFQDKRYYWNCDQPFTVLFQCFQILQI